MQTFSQLALPGTIVTSANPLEIGGDSVFGQFFVGLIDEVRVFNVARTPSQIQSDMNTPVGSLVPIVSLSSTSIDFGQQAEGSNAGDQVKRGREAIITTLRKIIAIKNVGRFLNYSASGQVDLKRYNLIFAENGRGKTTVCAILRSLQAGDPAHILGRTTLGTWKRSMEPPARSAPHIHDSHKVYYGIILYTIRSDI